MIGRNFFQVKEKRAMCDSLFLDGMKKEGMKVKY